MSVWTFVINRILISTNTIMMKIKKALLVLCAFCAISSQNLDDIFHIGLSYSWIHPIEVAQDFDSIPQDVIGDSILLNIYFEVVDTVHIDSFKFVIYSNNYKAKYNLVLGKISAGVSAFINEKIALDIGIGYQYIRSKRQKDNPSDYRSISNGFACSIGFSFVL
jgi:hypothetical protein